MTNKELLEKEIEKAEEMLKTNIGDTEKYAIRYHLLCCKGMLEESEKEERPANVEYFPKTFKEYAKYYGFVDDKQVYTNGSELIQIFRVEQWLAHIGFDSGKEVEE